MRGPLFLRTQCSALKLAGKAGDNDLPYGLVTSLTCPLFESSTTWLEPGPVPTVRVFCPPAALDSEMRRE